MNAPDAGILKQWRREFHAFPEIGWSEFVTTARLIEHLEGMGFTVLSGTAVINPAFVRGRVNPSSSRALPRPGRMASPKRCCSGWRA
jgi:metal-dependent amidase/aminoacylase/carboxypeptidase family protein